MYAPCRVFCRFYIFFFNDTATTEIYTLSLHDALPILPHAPPLEPHDHERARVQDGRERSEEHTSELQSRLQLVCRLLLEKTKHIYKLDDREFPAMGFALHNGKRAPT